MLWLSLLYVAGHACLAFFENSERGFYTGLFLIALGSGGIKPCVSAFVGDQFTVSNRSLVPKVFGWFYWSVNLGSFFASATMPKVLEHFGPRVAFAIPGVLMAVATLIFWAGRKLYVRVPPHEPDRHAFALRPPLRALREGTGRLLAARARPSIRPRPSTAPAPCSAWRASSPPSRSSGPASTRRRRSGCSRPGISTSRSAR